MREKSVAEIKQQIEALGPVLPGSISQQWNVCGKPGCRCKATRDPKRHGPYPQLSFTVRGHSSTLFLKPQEVALAREYVRRHRRFKALNAQLVLAYVALARRVGLAAMGKSR